MVRSIRKHLVSLNRKICKRLAIAGLFRDHCRNVSHGLGYVYSVVVVVVGGGGGGGGDVVIGGGGDVVVGGVLL